MTSKTQSRNDLRTQQAVLSCEKQCCRISSVKLSLSWSLQKRKGHISLHSKSVFMVWYQHYEIK